MELPTTSRERVAATLEKVRGYLAMTLEENAREPHEAHVAAIAELKKRAKTLQERLNYLSSIEDAGWPHIDP